MRNAIVIAQALTFIALGLLLLGTGEVRLGLAQGALAVATWLVYA